MKITKETNKLMSFFIDNNCLLPLKQNNKTCLIIQKLYGDINKGFTYVNDQTLNLKVEHITNINQIPKPLTFPLNAFPDKVRNHIDNNIIKLLKYNITIFDRNISILFLIEDEKQTIIEKYNDYVNYMLVWLYVVNMYSSKKCANELKIFIYHTNLLKLLPETNKNILNENNVNTAFTRTCPTNSEIVVFRKEEWFKVFIHETFHNFGLDFSEMNLDLYNEKILNIFSVNSEVNLFESYAECWARIINTMFFSFVIIKNKNDINDFLTNFNFFINFEIIFSFFQMIKVLDFMDLKYTDLYKQTTFSQNLRNNFYKEDTNVLSYYIITLILISNYQDFLLWCNTNNTSILNFKKTKSNLEKFYKLIEEKYKSKNLLDKIKCNENLFYKLKKLSKTTKQKNILYLLKNLRMTICEFQ